MKSLVENKNKKTRRSWSRWQWASSAFSNPRQGGGYFFIKIAAVVLLLAVISYVVNYFGHTGSETVTISSGDAARHVMLSDGSQIWLKAGSTANYPETFAKTGDRVVRFRGEATVEVVDADERPFILHAGKVTVTTMSTTFNVKSAQDTTEVFVLDGKVLLTATTQKLELESEEKAVYVSMTHEFKLIQPEE